MKAVKSGKAIQSNVKQNEMALANSIKIDLPTKVLKETTSGLLKVTPTFNKSGKLKNNVVQIKPNKNIIKPIIADEGYYLDSDSQTRYRFAKQSAEDIKKYTGIETKIPTMKKTGSGSMVKVVAPIGDIMYDDIPKLTKVQIISKLKELEPSLKNLAPKKKDELVILLQNFMKPKPLDKYKPGEIPPFKGNTERSYDPSLLDFGTERSFDPNNLVQNRRFKRLYKARRAAGRVKASIREGGLKITSRPPTIKGIEPAR